MYCGLCSRIHRLSTLQRVIQSRHRRHKRSLMPIAFVALLLQSGLHGWGQHIFHTFVISIVAAVGLGDCTLAPYAGTQTTSPAGSGGIATRSSGGGLGGADDASAYAAAAAGGRREHTDQQLQLASCRSMERAPMNLPLHGTCSGCAWGSRNKHSKLEGHGHGRHVVCMQQQQHCQRRSRPHFRGGYWAYMGIYPGNYYRWYVPAYTRLHLVVDAIVCGQPGRVVKESASASRALPFARRCVPS